jgi:hypothetical protein
MAKPILSKLVMPLFGPSQYSRHISDSFGMLQVKTPCFIFNQPHIGSRSIDLTMTFNQLMQEQYLPPGTPHVAD